MTEKPTYEGLEKRVAELEQQAEQFQSAIYNSISHSIFVVDVLENNVFQYVSLNPRHEKITGISQDFIHGKTPEELLPEKAAQAVRHRYADCVNQKQNVTYEEWLPFQGKETCWETTLHPQINENGQVCQIIGTSQEITERVRYQNEIKESEERFRLLVESSPISVMMMRNGKYTYCNPASIALLGFNRLEDIFGMDALQTIAPEFHSTLRERMERVELGKSNAPIEIKIIKPNGDAVWTRSTSLSISIKGEPTAVIFGQDITKQRETEIALRESEEKHRSMMESMDDAAYICSSNYRIEYMNPAMIRKIGHDATGARCYKAIHGLEEQCPWCEHDKVIKGEPIKTELDLTKEDESFLISHSPIFHTNGSVSKLSIYRDITEKTKLEYRMQQSQKMESIGSLAGGIAHDFNNILFPIVGLSEMMLEDFPPGSLEQQNLNEIFQAGKRGRELIQQILSFSRRSEHQPIPVHIQKILKEVLKLCRATIPADITIAQDIMADCAPVMADPTQIHQIAMNLITNAYHAVEPAGGTIKVALKEIDLCHEDGPDVHLASGRYAVLSVIDTGTGIDPAVMNRIFDPYFTTKEKGRGTGLGLATVYGIVKDHGGDIRVHSEMGKGSFFHVYLPLLEKALESEPGKKITPLPTGTGHILLVDDEKSIIHLETQMLKRLGYQTSVFISSREALAAFKTEPSLFDLVITDMNMPNINGMQLAVEMIAVRPDIPIILCTGFSERIDNKKAEAQGIRGLLMKPVGMKDLALKVREVLNSLSKF